MFSHFSHLGTLFIFWPKKIKNCFLKQANPKLVIIFNKVWPANIFANNRIDKLKILAIWEIISITINGGIKTVGTLDGTNNFKYCNPWIENQE